MQRDIDRDRQIYRGREIQRYTYREIEGEADMPSESYIYTHIHRDTYRDREAEIQRQRDTGRYT